MRFSLRPDSWNDKKQTFMKTEGSQSDLESIDILYRFAWTDKVKVFKTWRHSNLYMKFFIMLLIKR